MYFRADGRKALKEAAEKLTYDELDVGDAAIQDLDQNAFDPGIGASRLFACRIFPSRETCQPPAP